MLVLNTPKDSKDPTGQTSQDNNQTRYLHPTGKAPTSIVALGDYVCGCLQYMCVGAAGAHRTGGRAFPSEARPLASCACSKTSSPVNGLLLLLVS